MPKLADLQALEILLRLPDDAALTTDEAAIVLRTSPRTLERMRSPGSTTKGPDYIQGGDKGARGSNQRVTYTKKALQDWQRDHTVSNNLEAAVRRGQLFESLPSLVEPAPFWKSEDGSLLGAADETELEVFIARVGRTEIEWLPPIEAGRRGWSDDAAFTAFAKRMAGVLGHELDALNARIEYVEIVAAPPVKRS